MHYALCIMHFHIVIFYIKRRAASAASSEMIVGPADGVLRHGRSAFPTYPLFRINCVSSPPLYIHYNFSSPSFLSCFLASPAIIFIFFPRFSSLPYYVRLLSPLPLLILFIFPLIILIFFPLSSSSILYSSSSPSPPPCCIRLRSPLLLLVIFIFAPLLSPLFLQPSPPPSPWAILIVSSASPSMPSQPNHKPCHQHPIVSILMAHSDETMRMTGHWHNHTRARRTHTHIRTHARTHARQYRDIAAVSSPPPPALVTVGPRPGAAGRGQNRQEERVCECLCGARS